MALFKQIDCAECGKQTKPVFRTKLSDGQFICSDCTSVVPSYMLKTFWADYTLEDYRALKEYIRFSNETLRPIFHETSHYCDIHLDEDNYIFYLGYKIAPDTIFFQLTNVSEFDLIFSPEEFKEGILNDKVKGDVLFELEMEVPRFAHEEKIDKKVSATAKKKLFGSKVSYEDPPEMSEFLLKFKLALIEALEKTIEEDSSELQDLLGSDLNQAMALFMLDSLDGVTLDDLKAHRNRMIKAFHPDTGSEADTKYAQKINAAYDTLKSHLSS